MAIFYLINGSIWFLAFIAFAWSFFVPPLKVTKSITSKGMIRIISIVSVMIWMLLIGFVQSVRLLSEMPW